MNEVRFSVSLNRTKLLINNNNCYYSMKKGLGICFHQIPNHKLLILLKKGD